ncbi:hypothetical protein [Dactylosporangium sp. CA-233914]|uniref:hypothetical protein n=1 Tax=Dactylosporangium sp. CA-233914 TaxID=3239934 RepID=UPI003D9217B3
MRFSARRPLLIGLAGLVAAGTLAAGTAYASASASTKQQAQAAAATVVRDQFDSLNQNVWHCEFTCPTISGGLAKFNLKPGIPANQAGSWSKIGYRPKRFTKGSFTIRFALTQRPKQPVWWGLALWDDGPAANGSQFNEINFGYTTDQSFTNTQLRFESAKRGHDVSLKVDTGVNLYDGKFHTGTLEYASDYVAFYLDDRLLKVISDESVIPTDPMELVIGPRLVAGKGNLTQTFTETVDWVKIES